MNRPVVVGAVRTPIGKFLGAFSDLSAADLGTAAVAGLLERTGVPGGAVDELVFGNARQAGGGPNVARQVAVRAGIPKESPAWTLNMACASGLRAIAEAADRIRLGRGEVLVAGGTESMSALPYLLPKARTGYRLGHAKLVDAMFQDGFLCPLCGDLMGETAERLAREYGIPRAEQDAYAVETQRRCEAARKEGRFADEIVPVEVPGRKGGGTIVSVDEHPRDGVTADDLAKLPPVFAKDGTVTAGNASGITDGAAAVLLASEERAHREGWPVLAAVEGDVSVGVDPAIMGIGPVPAVRKLEGVTGRKLDAYDRIEINEAFAAQVLACRRDLDFPMDRLNVLGGAIALGHPIGATGARIVVTLLHELARSGGRAGLATLCVSGGLGMAVSFTR